MSDWGFAFSAEWASTPWTVGAWPLPMLCIFRGQETHDLHVKVGRLLLTIVCRKGGFCRGD
jgi:hypothetical protein